MEAVQTHFSVTNTLYELILINGWIQTNKHWGLRLQFIYIVANGYCKKRSSGFPIETVSVMRIFSNIHLA